MSLAAGALGASNARPASQAFRLATPSRTAAHDGRRAVFMGVPLHLLTLDETVAAILQHIRSGTPLHQVSLNVAKLVNMRKNKELAADVMSADLVLADGMGIVLGARLLGIAVPERVAGVDLMERLLALCAAEGLRPYFLGARPEVLSGAIQRVTARYPGLKIAGCQHGYYAACEEDGIVETIRRIGPDCLFVGMPTPQKERFMARHHARLDVPYIMGVGGSIDILAGHVQRAPLVWQRAGFEWLFRIVQEPRRMWRRYLTTNTAYVMLLVAAILQHWVRRGFGRLTGTSLAIAP
jgi:N-acetylglucosaminyldiphosphoundecaprenol N-acetyl-beta-D-mannosaminyltransferase